MLVSSTYLPFVHNIGMAMFVTYMTYIHVCRGKLNVKREKYISVMMTIVKSDADEPTSQCPSELSQHMSKFPPRTSAFEIVCVFF